MNLPPIPKGFTLDQDEKSQGLPPIPAGFTLDSNAVSSQIDSSRANSPTNLLKRVAQTGPTMGAFSGIEGRDIPGVAASFLNGVMQFQPKTIERYPKQFLQAGTFGSNFAQGAELASNVSNMPRAATEFIRSRGLNIPNAPQGFQPPFRPNEATIIPRPQTLSGQVAGGMAEIMGSASAPTIYGKVGKFIDKIKSSEALEILNQKAGSIWNSGKNLKAVEQELVKQPRQALDISNKIRETKFGSGEELTKITNDFKVKNELLNKALSDESLLQSGKNKLKLRNTFKNMSQIYRRGIDNAEDVLSKKGETVTSQEYLDKVINKTISTLRSRNVPEDNPAFVTLNRLSKSMQSGSPETGVVDATGMTIKVPAQPSEKVSLIDIKNLKNNIYDTLSNPTKSGTVFADTDEHVAMEFLRTHGEFIGGKSSELSQLNKEFAPMANARRWAMQKFRPYNDAELKKGVDVLKNIVSDKPNPDSINYLKVLEEGSGEFQGAGNLRGRTTQLGSDINLLKRTFNTAKQNLIDSTDFSINQLQNQLADLKGKGIELSFERDRLKYLLNIKRAIVGTTFLAVRGLNPTVKKITSKLITG